jgi:hypothetical protein
MITETQIDAVRRFWQWFSDNAEHLKILYESGKFESLAQDINRELNRIEPQLAWEMGAGKREAHLFTISAEGNPNLRAIARLMVERAPEMSG